MQVCLFEDAHVEKLWPVTLVRPAFSLTMGGVNLWDWAWRSRMPIFAASRQRVSDWVKRNFSTTPCDDDDVVYVNACMVPDLAWLPQLEKLEDECCYKRGERVLVARSRKRGPERLHNVEGEQVADWLANELEPQEAGDEMPDLLEYAHEVVRYNLEIFQRNAQILSQSLRCERPGLYLEEGVQLGEHVIVDASDENPVIIGAKTKVLGHNYFLGPVIIGDRNKLIEHSSVKEYSCTGQVCKIGGEVEASIIESFSNKQHHGFFGHGWVGSWVNLGAGTSNSDLKNTYGKVQMNTHDRGKVDSGMTFLGSLIGDYSKSAINTSIFTGKVIGVNAMLYGFVTEDVPSFCNYARSLGAVSEMDVHTAQVIQQRMFARRQKDQSEADKKMLLDAFTLTADRRVGMDSTPPKI